MTRLALLLALAACSSPVDVWTEPVCVAEALPGHVLNADSLSAEGWTVLPGDTIAVRPDAEEGCHG